ncbi:hypothetical protein CPT32_30740 [Rhizobium sophoriradicis]|nr:hypothetical protein CPT32_30740 [Rhizobium sophoriradicis]PDS71819.1 hypothetical protein CO667_33910 [Rhizobium sp. L43]
MRSTRTNQPNYRWHPYFGQRVSIRRVEERATGRFLKVLGSACQGYSEPYPLMASPCAVAANNRPSLEAGVLMDR